jgi:SAM-dependent methyltransferase
VSRLRGASRPADDSPSVASNLPVEYRECVYCCNKMAKGSRDTLYAPLRLPWLYNLLQGLVGGSRDRADFVKTHVLFRPDEKVVDAGCGTGSALEFLPPVNYVGFDPNSGYIHAAQSRYGSRGQFLCGDADSPEVWELAQSADTFLSFGVLHHLTDSQIKKILSLARRCLRPSGRFIFYEPCFSASDDVLGRIFMSLDRGGNIKSDQAWRALLSEYFATLEEHIRRPVYWFRYTIQAFICRDPREG